MNILDVSNLEKSYGPTRLMDGISFAVDEADRVGLVGRNGCGKSTLLKILAGLETPDGGRIARKKGLTVAYLAQEPDLDPAATVRQVLESHLGEARAKLSRHAELAEALAGAEGGDLEALLAEQQGIHDWLDHHGGWNLAPRIDELCSRFAIGDPDARVGTLSGGWARRVALAAALVGRPDVLVLDEPTNQLDADTVGWLEEHLIAYPGAVVLVTHDRYFLDRVVGRMFELERGKLTPYAGGYSAYLAQKAERLALEARSQTRLLNLLRREEAWLARGAKARSTKQKARIGRVADLRARRSTGPGREVGIEFKTTARLGGVVLEASKLEVAVPGRTLVRDLDFVLRKGERVGILGPNGCGKTTLVKTLLGRRPPAGGAVTVGKNTRVGYLDQARSGLDPETTVAEALGEGDWVQVGGPRGERRHKAGYLESFLFDRDDQRQPVSTLSGGERARLLLARLMLQGANVLVLDEPTNDLDLPTLQILDEALTAFTGSVLVVTHDRYFLDRVATGILQFAGDGDVSFYEGNYEVFQRLRARADRPRAEEGGPKPRKDLARTAPSAPTKRLSYKETRELEALETEIEALEARKGELEALLSDPSSLQGGRETLAAISAEFSTVERRLDENMQRWEALEGKREGTV